MIVPTAIPFSAIKLGQVFSNDLILYFIKVGITSAVNLATGDLKTDLVPTNAYTVFPSAALVLGAPA